MFAKIKELLLLNFVFPLAEKVMGTNATFWYREIKKMNNYSPNEIIQWQNNRLQKFIIHVYENTVYYRNLFDKLGIKPENIKTVEDLKKIPPIDKNIIRDYHDEIIPKNIKQISHRKGETGGTTGMPLKYFYDEDTWGYITAAKIYAWKTTGFKYGNRFVTIGSSSLFPTNKKSWKHIFYHALRNGIPLNGMNMSDEVCKEYVDILIKKRIQYIYGYAASIFLLTKYVQKQGVSLPLIKGIFTTSEILTPQYRKEMTNVFNCSVMDCYGARDAGITAYEVENGIYHVGYNAISEMELIYDDGTGTLLVTNILNYSFPLIRYRVGDDVCLKSENKESNYNGQTITKVVGRTSDVMIFDNGHKLTATGFSVMIRKFNVEAFRMTKISGLSLLVEIQKNISYTDSENELLIQTLKKHIGTEVELELKPVSAFEPLQNGKRQFFIT